MHRGFTSSLPMLRIVATTDTRTPGMTIRRACLEFAKSRSSEPRLPPRPTTRIFATSAPPRLAAKASYLIRDTMKAMGYSEEAPAPIVACFTWPTSTQATLVTRSASAGNPVAGGVSGCLERLDGRTGFGVQHTENLQLPIQGAFFKFSLCDSNTVICILVV